MKHPDPRIQSALDNLNKARKEALAKPPPGKKKAKPATWTPADYQRKPQREKKEYKVIPCRCCEKDFKSEGPGNRLCNKCRKNEPCPYESFGNGHHIERRGGS